MNETPKTPDQTTEPVQEPAPAAEETQRAPLSDKKRNALLRYMAILFGVAFLLVLLSFLIQIRDSRETISDLNKSNASALQNAGKLQEENQQLTAANADLEEQLEENEADLDDAQKETGRLEKENEQLKQQLEEAETAAEETQTAYELLMQAQTAADDEDYETLKTVLAQLAPVEARLSEEARAQYTILSGLLTAENP